MWTEISHVTISPSQWTENWYRIVLETHDVGQRAALTVPKHKSSRSYAIESAAQ